MRRAAFPMLSLIRGQQWLLWPTGGARYILVRLRRICSMSKDQPNNPLHGITLELVVTKLVDRYGWDGLAQKIDINCFKSDPSIKSSLKFLRKTPWARKKVESLYVSTFGEQSPWGNFGSSASHRTKH